MFNKSHGVFKSSIDYLLCRDNVEYLEVSIIELYGSDFRDLLNSDDTKITINSSGKSIVTSAVKQSVSKTFDLDCMIGSVLAKRSTRPTNQNITSSRSHLFIVVEKAGSASQLVLADLAGFERTEDKENLPESISINGTLSHFNKVLLDLKQKGIPNFNGNCLTSFLKPVLGQTKTIVYYHVLQSSIAKYLNLVDQLMMVRVIKRHANGSSSSVNNKHVKTI